MRAVAQAGAKLVDTSGVEAFTEAMERESGVSRVALTRLAVKYEIMSVEEIPTIVRLVHARGARVRRRRGRRAGEAGDLRSATNAPARRQPRG